MAITGLPSATMNGTFVDRISTNALQKIYARRVVRQFLQNDASFSQQLNQSFDKGVNATVRIKPIAGVPQSITDHSTATPIVYEDNAYGTVNVTLDEEVVKGWLVDGGQFSVTDVSQQVIEADKFEANAEQIAIYLEKKATTALVNSPVAGASIGVSGTKLNWELLKQLRAKASAYGIPRDVYLDVLISSDVFNDLYDIAQITNRDYFTQADFGSNWFSIGQGLNLNLIETNYMDRSVSTLPVLVAFPTNIPVGVLITRPMAVAVPSQQKLSNYEGISLLYTETFGDYNGSLKKFCKLAVLTGAKTFSGNINASGVQQTAPIFKALGGI